MALTPMMQQYFELKEQYGDCLLFFRLGDFYEMFFDDAKTASRELELVLTGRDCGEGNRAPMCGVPFHAADNYIAKLIDKGYRVAICEQLEDPAAAKGLVKRGVVRIVTPGTYAEGGDNKAGENIYLLSLDTDGNAFYAAYTDVSTGEFCAETLESKSAFVAFLTRLAPGEIIYSKAMLDDFPTMKAYTGHISRDPYAEWAYEKENALRTLKEHFAVTNLEVFGINENSKVVSAAGALIAYLEETQKNSLMHINKIEIVRDDRFMAFDSFTMRNLELVTSMRSKGRKGSLLNLLDKTETPMGARLLKTYIERPLQNKKDIDRRLEAVSELVDSFAMRTTLKEALGKVYDIERLVSKIAYSSFDARNANALRVSLEQLPQILETIGDARSKELSRIRDSIDALPELAAFLKDAILEKPAIGLKDGGFINDGFCEELDKLRSSSKNSKAWLASLEQREKERLGIKTLKVGYNRVFGYYIEIPRSQADIVPLTYIRKQTLSNSERYITNELKELEDLILNSDERAKKLEAELFDAVRNRIIDVLPILQKNARLVAECDVYLSFARTAYDYGYVRPKIVTNGIIDIKNGRHPVVEQASRMEFVPNDVYLDMDKNRLLVITGPNMAGKSTFLRQTALITVMAHMGSFVPASSATISITDRVFTRVGASDDLAAGESTFMVEMTELASILRNATDKSLIILDEIGRGTSTLDGLSIAWATIEYISNAKTLFATHYHELTDLEGITPGVLNYSVSIKEYDDTIIFLHKIKRGGADRSFGIEVARLAGLPEPLLARAKELLYRLEANKGAGLDTVGSEDSDYSEHLLAKKKNKVFEMVRGLDIDNLTPLEALSILNDLKQQVTDG